MDIHLYPWQYAFLIISLILLLVSSGIFSATETAYTSLSKAKIETMIEKKVKGHKIIEKQHNFFNRTLGTILIANNLVNIASSTLLAYLLTQAFGASKVGLASIISTIVMTPIIVLFAEIIPKLIAKRYPEKTVKSFYWFIEMLYWIFIPITYPISKIGKKIYITNTEEDVKSLLNIAQDEGVLEFKESVMAQNVLDLDSTKVSQHYIKMKNVDFLSSKATMQEALAMFKETNYSRIPVEKDGDLIGILLLKDIFFLQRGNILNYIKSVPRVSANSILSVALEKMRQSRAQMAFVTESNNDDKAIGIITIEDILEEVVGEIYDEYDNDEQIYEISLERCEAKGTVLMKTLWKQLELDQYLDYELDDKEKNQTLSAWLETKKGHALRKNSKFELDEKITFKVLEKKNKDQKYDYIEIDWSN
ncbi:hemolysin family protein [Mycoplasmopsis arginini]|uniref:HlyC/CorC family transporter n=1 Tax=Mycoplasmopsis arginini TaxID=2094 RepID=A0AA43U071_MYCAR|nr:hemolysin family protein [Mycoplasmopsis arginini]MCY2903050.1 HlyC/CorC family transporter [Mycoplasmopsis arginini QMP CG1-2758]MDI3349761.1 HlyC/CorC family transporter [Mycoplasmopsis arginini]MDI3350372.1 HlyC/CorC family transporter [Mycoplasmopsis arginini]MDI3350764.1 HlyC/CorC family transporter [Mycoplasmopsis arginini]MDI3351432.1 HlyC/CorC family transporter [Mycoplasmopsis arginini]